MFDMVAVSVSPEEILFFSACAIVVGIYLLIKGGNLTIDAAVFVAKKLNISPLLIGFTVIAFGTSLPELVVSINANLKDYGGLSLGNVIGSNITNILLCIGLCGLITVISSQSKMLKYDLGMMVFASFLLWAVLESAIVERWQGGLLFFVLIAYVIFQYRTALKTPEIAKNVESEIDDEDAESKFTSVGIAIGFLGLGLLFVIAGSEILVRGAIVGAKTLQIPEAVIGMTIVAIGTSLPEIVTCVAAARRAQIDMVIGNIVGSNVFNILSIVGLTAIFKPINLLAVDPRLLTYDLWFMIAVSVLFAGLMLFYKKINKPIATVFLGGFVLFIADQYFRFFV